MEVARNTSPGGPVILTRRRLTSGNGLRRGLNTADPAASISLWTATRLGLCLSFFLTEDMLISVDQMPRAIGKNQLNIDPSSNPVKAENRTVKEIDINSPVQ